MLSGIYVFMKTAWMMLAHEKSFRLRGNDILLCSCPRKNDIGNRFEGDANFVLPKNLIVVEWHYVFIYYKVN
ncbi:MAG: hypothetical protein FJ041_04995 [Candidatus Cloacimonetes bacterium]|nr:hypothetical protein [Candidatus Cloacimonadota bacterium]